MERDKFKFDYSSLHSEMKNKNTLIEELEYELVQTKQKLGDVLNEMSEAEQLNISSARIGEKKTKFSFFSKKK